MERKPAKKAHMGFEKAEKSIMRKEHLPKERAGAILASAARKASPEAKRENPALKHVKMAAPGKRRAYDED
jgi:hypothetical protein